MLRCSLVTIVKHSLAILVYCIQTFVFPYLNAKQTTMKKLFVLACFPAILLSCGKKEEKKENHYPEKILSSEEQLIQDGKRLFNSNKAACFSCHQVDKKVIGPSIKEIA